MLNIELSIHRDGVDYVYTNAELVDKSATIGRSIEGMDIEVDDADMYLRSDLAGISDPFAIPAGESWRARIRVLDTDTFVLDGAIATEDVTYESVQDRWKVRVRNSAPLDFWALMDQYWLQDGESPDGPGVRAPDAVLVDCIVESATSTGSETRYFSPMVSMIEHSLLIASERSGVSMDLSTPDAEWLDGIHIHVDHWRLKTIIEQLTSYCGWRTRVEYASFPGRDLSVQMLTTAWDHAQPVNDQRAVDDDIIEDGYEIKTIRRGNRGIAMDGSVQSSDFDPSEYDFDVAEHPPWANVAVREWSATPPITEIGFTSLSPRPVLADPSELNAEPAELRLRIPAVRPHADVIQDGYVYGIPLVPERRYQKTIYRRAVYPTRTDPLPMEGPSVTPGRAESSEAEVAIIAFLIQGVPTSGAFWKPAFGSGLPTNPVWPRENWSRHEMRVNDLVECKVSVRTDIRLSLGVQDVWFLDRDWMIVEDEYDLDSDVHELTLVRPASELGEAAIPQSVPTFSTPQFGTLNELQFTVLELTAEIKTIDLGVNGLRDLLQVTWERSALRYSTEIQYEVTITESDGTSTTRTVNGTNFVQELAPEGSGGQSYDLDVAVTPISWDQTVGNISQITVTN